MEQAVQSVSLQLGSLRRSPQNRHLVAWRPLSTEGYGIFPTCLWGEKHTSSGTNYRLIWSQFILREGQRWPDEHDRRLLT